MTIYGLVWVDFNPKGGMEKVLEEIGLLKKILIYRVIKRRSITHIFVSSRTIVDKIINILEKKGFLFKIQGNKGNFIRLKNQ